jgi:hypothetical protein
MSSDTRSAGQRRCRRAFLWLSAGSWGLVAVAHAGDARPAPVDGDLEAVVVTGRLEEDLPLDLQKYGTRIDIVSAEQIRNGGEDAVLPRSCLRRSARESRQQHTLVSMAAPRSAHDGLFSRAENASRMGFADALVAIRRNGSLHHGRLPRIATVFPR